MFYENRIIKSAIKLLASIKYLEMVSVLFVVLMNFLAEQGYGVPDE